MNQSRAKILVVDDDGHLLELLVETLEAIGYEAVGAGDGVQALELLKSDSFDLMITDIKMPNLDGIGLLKKARRYYSEMPVLFISGFATPEIIGRATPDGFLAKPFRISHIEELIGDALAGRGQSVPRPVQKVMVVDDDDAFRQALSEMLLAHDYQPLALSSADEALRELRHGEVDAVVADVKMPGTDGTRLLRLIKDRTPDLPVILITGRATAPETESVQPDGFLRKPFRAERIVTMLNSLIVRQTD